MHNFFDKKINKQIISISPGEYFISNDHNIVIQTILGSCIAVCLYTDIDGYSGMNHFMLPESIGNHEVADTDSGRYGMYSMEILINSLLKAGVKKNYLKAKIFGGGNVLDFKSIKNSVGENNIAFINEYLEKERIPIVSSHVGGDFARKILFFTDSKRVLLKKIERANALETIKEEELYQKTLVKDEKKKTNIIIF